MDITGILLLTCGGILLLVAFMWLGGKYLLPNFPQQWDLLAEELGLQNRNPKGIYFDLRGRIDRIDVALDVIHQEYAAMVSHSPGSSTRPWARVRASLPEKPSFQIRSRHQKSREKMEYPVRETGDLEFDAKYELFAPENANLDTTVPRAVREALTTADPPVHIMKNMVLWTEKGFNKKPAWLKQALGSCVRVAQALNAE